LRTAQLNLSYTKITAPIAGRIGQSSFSVGNLVGPTSNALARIVQVDPIRVVFSVSDQTLLQIRESAGDVSREELYTRFVPTLRLSNGSAYGKSGQVDFIGNEVDPQTGTIPVWARFDNPNGVLVPGQYATVVIRRAQPRRRPIVPLGAVQQDRDGQFVLLLDDKNQVQSRRVKTGAQIGQDWAVNEGLQGGERLIIEGIQNARPGLTVQPVQASSANSAQPPGGQPATQR